jgi:hypothetical protein
MTDHHGARVLAHIRRLQKLELRRRLTHNPLTEKIMFSTTLNSLMAEIRELDDTMSERSESCARCAHEIASAIDHATVAIADAQDIVNALPEDDDEEETVE